MQSYPTTSMLPAPEPPEPRQCFKCNFEGMGTNITCPRCRRNHFLNVSSIRIRGTFLIVIGLFMVAFMGGIAIFVAALLLGSASQNVSSARRLNDEIPMLILIYGIFALVIALGLNSLISGLWMIVTGR